MNINQNDYRIMLKLLEDAIRGEYEGVKDKSGPYNRGLKRAYQDVLEMFSYTTKRAAG